MGEAVMRILRKAQLNGKWVLAYGKNKYYPASQRDTEAEIELLRIEWQAGIVQDELYKLERQYYELEEQHPELFDGPGNWGDVLA